MSYDSKSNFMFGLSKFGPSVVDTTKNVTNKIKNVAINTKNQVCDKINDYKEEQHNKRQKVFNSKIAKFKDTRIKEFIDLLEPNCIDIDIIDIHFVKKLFPILNNQYIFWKSINADKKKCGIVITDGGIIIKYKKGKNYELNTYPWYSFDFDFFLSKENCEGLYTLGEECITHFLECCSKVGSCDIEYVNHNGKVKTNFIYKNDDFIKGTLINTSASSSIDSTTIVAKNASVNTPGGHGILAEEANNIVDKMLFRDATIVGRDNAKYGPDRLVNRQYIQTKYHKTAGKSVGSAFDSSNNGMYKYVNDDGTIMQLEVPKDQYEQAVERFADKISQGKVPGVTDPNDATKYVRKGYITYNQAVQIAKAGTIESIFYDALTGVVTCSFAFGISFIIQSFMVYLQTKNLKQALLEGLKAGSYVFGVSLFEYVVLNQLARTEFLNEILKDTLKGTIFTSVLTFSLFSIKDTYLLCSHKISGSQYYMNISSLAGSIIASFSLGLVGTKVGASTGLKSGGVVGGIIGGVVGGLAAGVGISAANKIFLDDDATIFIRVFNSYISLLSYEYMLNGEEIDLLLKELEKINNKQMKKLIEKFISSDNQEKTIRSFLNPFYEQVISKREKYSLIDLQN